MVTYAWPFPTELINDEFGWRVHPITGVRTHHNGADFGVSGGTPIPAAAEGRVVWSGANGGEGNSVHVQHPDGGLTKYFHMVRTNVNRGDYVNQGDILGWVGTSGASTGNHLHFETWGDGIVQDPRVFMREHGADNPAARPEQEDDMYDAGAEARSFAKIETEARVFKAYNWGTGIIVLGPGGKQWNLPNMDYYILGQALGLWGQVIRSIPENERSFLVWFLSTFAPDPANEAAVDKVLALSEEDVQRLVAAIPEQRITLLPQDVETIAQLVAEKSGTTTRDAVVDALKSITINVK